MKRAANRGVSTIEFAFSMLVLVPMLLGTGAIGINMVRTHQVIQLARDAGHMYARGLDLSQPGNKTIIGNVGSDVGLSTTAGAGDAVVILSSLTYVDRNACAAVGAVDAGGNPTSACTNFTRWVFTQRIVIGKSSLRASAFGSPLTSGPTGVIVDTATGKISAADYCTKAGAVANFSGINPYSVVDGIAQGLPSGQVLYLAEAAGTGFNMRPFVSNASPYSFAFF